MNTKEFDPYDFSKRKIAGVPVYYKNLPWAPCIHIRLVFNSGAFDDPIGKEGLSHFLEHMIFDGSPILPDKKSIKEWSKFHSLNTWNAWTGFDNTCYYLKCLPEEYDTVLLGIKDMVFKPYLRSDDVEHERRVIMQEVWGRFQNEKFLSYTKESLINLYHGHHHERLGNAVGWPDTVKTISREDIVSFHKDKYGIGNFYIVLVGSVEEKHIDSLNLFLRDIPKVCSVNKDKDVLDKPKQKRFIKIADEIGEIKEQVEISFVRVAEKIPQEETEIVNVFGRLIRDILNERLRTELGLCYGINLGTSRHKTYSQMNVNIKTEEKNIDLVEKEVKIIFNEIINKKYINRFDIIKTLYIEQIRAGEFLSSDIADNAVDDISDFGGDVVSLKKLLEEIEKVKYEDMIKFVKWAFDPEYIFTEIILPSKKHKSYNPLAFFSKIWHSLCIKFY